jgi:hypothetical protein
MDTVAFGRWTVAGDAESTRRDSALVSQGSPEACGCKECRNFAEQRGQVYPPPVLELFAALGIDSTREAEIYHMAAGAQYKHLYGGWFHSMGSVQEGRDAARQVAENIWKPDLEPVSESFSLGFTSKNHLAPKPFEGLRLVRVEFTVELPWVLETSAPER